MSEVTEIEQTDNVVQLGDFAQPGKVRRAHRRVRPIDGEQVADVQADEPAAPAEAPIPPATLAIARSRYATVINRYKADLIAAQRQVTMFGGSGNPTALAYQQTVREQGIAEATRKLAEAEQIDGWDLIHLTRADQPGIYRA